MPMQGQAQNSTHFLLKTSARKCDMQTDYLNL